MLGKHLVTRTFFIRERIMLADITVASAITHAVPLTLNALTRAKYLPSYPAFGDHHQPAEAQDIFGEP
jgi:hypothetical protein